jgi:hypothetical protein
MVGDHFYSDYRESTLLVLASVSGIKSLNGGTELIFASKSKDHVRCTLAVHTAVPVVGSTIRPKGFHPECACMIV